MKTSMHIELTSEHVAMLDAICAEAGGISRTTMAKNLLVALLEDDAAAHGAFSNPDEKIVILRNYLRADHKTPEGWRG